MPFILIDLEKILKKGEEDKGYTKLDLYVFFTKIGISHARTSEKNFQVTDKKSSNLPFDDIFRGN